MEWTNEDWMRVYGALRELIIMYDFQHQNSSEHYFGAQKDVALDLIEKLEFMFRGHDETSKGTKVQSDTVSRFRDM